MVERMVEVSWSTRDGRRRERIAVVCAMLKGGSNGLEVARVLERSLHWMCGPSTEEDVVFARMVLTACLSCPSLGLQEVQNVVARFWDERKTYPARLWVVGEIIRSAAPEPAKAALVKRFGDGDEDNFDWVNIDYLPACLDAVVALGKLASSEKLQQRCFIWLESMCLQKTDAGNLTRACMAVMVWLERVWEMEVALMGKAMSDMFGRLTECKSTQVPPLAFSLALSLIPEAFVASFPELMVAEHMRDAVALARVVTLLCQFPARPAVVVLLSGVLEELHRREAKDALFRITFEGGLAFLVLQLYVPSCRAGSLVLLEKLLLGWQANPDAFHAVFPALTHVVGFLKQERDFWRNQTTALGRLSSQEDSGAGTKRLSISALQGVDVILRQETAPSFDPKAAYYDYERTVNAIEIVDVLPELARVIFDQTQLHTGFFSSLHAPLVRAVRPDLPMDYSSNLSHLRQCAWSRNLLQQQANKRGAFSRGRGAGVVDLASAAEMTEQLGPRVAGLGVGLVNLGNTCYLNSLMQCLFHAGLFSNQLLSVQQQQQQQQRHQSRIHREMAHLFEQLNACPKRAFVPSSFVGVVPERFQLGEQQDANEFAKTLFELLEREDGKSGPSQYWIGKTATRIRCGRCAAQTRSVEPFTDLDLAIPWPEQDPSTTPSVQSLVDRTFLTPEALGGENKFRCNVCADFVDAQRMIDIVAAPEFLMVTLLRFAFRNGKIQKLTHAVQFGETLLLPVMLPPPSSDECGDDDLRLHRVPYRLFGVLVHSGASTAHGHYFAYCCNDAGKWQLFDDSRVTASSLSEAQEARQNANPYILFFQRVHNH